MRRVSRSLLLSILLSIVQAVKGVPTSAPPRRLNVVDSFKAGPGRAQRASASRTPPSRRFVPSKSPLSKGSSAADVQGEQPRDKPEPDRRVHLVFIAREKVPTTGQMIWGSVSSTFELPQKAVKAVGGVVKDCALGVTAVGSAVWDGVATIAAQAEQGQQGGSGPLVVPSLNPAYHREVMQITRVLQETHMGLITEFCKVAQQDPDDVFSLIVNVVITSHHCVLTSRDATLAGSDHAVAIDCLATRFLAVAGGVLYVCKPATSVDSLFDSFVAPPVEDHHALNPDAYFAKSLKASSLIDTCVAFKQYFERTAWPSTLAQDPNLTLDPALQARIEEVWATYKHHHGLRMDEVRRANWT